MKIVKDAFPGAILPEDRESNLILDGGGTLLLSRNNCAISIKGTALKNVTLCQWTVWCLPRKTRLGRFFQALPAVWRFCK